MGAVFHTRLVAAQQRRRHAFGHGEVDELARPCERSAYDLNGFGVLRIGVVHLQIVLRYIGWIRHAAADEVQFAAEADEPRDLGRGKEVFDFQEHVRVRSIVTYRESAPRSLPRALRLPLLPRANPTLPP